MNVQFINNFSGSSEIEPDHGHSHDHTTGSHTHGHGPEEHGHTHEHLEHAGVHCLILIHLTRRNYLNRKILGTRSA